MNIGKNNPTSRLGTKFCFDNNISREQDHREVGSLEIKFIPRCETNQWCGFPTQASNLYENSFCVSCFFVGTLLCVYHFGKNP
jgi:hypothetical protein